MNLIDNYVIEVFGYEKKYNHWFVSVLAENEGGKYRTHVMVNTEEQAKQVSKGYKFLS